MGTVTDRKRSHASCYFAPRASVGGGGGGSEMKARPMDTAGGTPGPAGRSSHASFSGPSSRTKAEGAAGVGTPVSGALGAALLAAAALLFAPGDARALSECGSAINLPITCTDTSYPDGIFYGTSDDDHQPRGNGPINVAGSSTATTTITSTSRMVVSGGTTTTSPSVGLYVYGHQGSFQWNDVNVGVTVDSMGEMTDAGHVVNIVQGTSTNNAADRNNGIYFQHRNQMGDSTVRVGRGVTIGSETTPMRQNGIFYHPRGTSTWGAAKATLISAARIFAAKQGIRLFRNPSNVYHPTYRRTSDTTITNSGAIRSGEEGIYLYFERPAGGAIHLGDATITNTGAITVTGARYGIFMDYRGYGDTEIDNAGTIAAAAGSGIHLAHNNNGAVTLTNSGDVAAATVGLRLGKYNGAGTVTITNSGGVTVRAAAAAGVGHALWLWEGGLATGGPATITNSGVLSSKNHALFAQMSAANAAALTLTNTGAVASANGDGIRIERGVEGDVTFANGGTSATSGNVSGKGHGIYIGKAARIDFDQTAGRISGRTGVYAEVTRSLTTGGTRSTTSGGDHDPAIDIDWTGGTIARGTATTDNGRFAAASAAQVLAFDQEAEAVKAVAGSARWGSAAGIEAHALSWRDVVAQVAAGDDPGALTAGAGGLIISGGTTTTAVPATATASDNTYIAQFKAALENGDLTVAPAVLTAIGTTATTAVADLTDAQIRTYLRTNTGATRTLLRNVLAQGLSDKEKAVLRAVAAGDSTALTTALDDTAAAFSSAYKTAVRALLDRYNLDDVRVSVSGGSIDSHGDGIRAYYATGHDNNGGIDVTIAAGATVSGGVNGILVSGSGTTSTGTKNQAVTVAGTVMGGTGAGVHLIGGGEVTVNAGGVVGATSGTAISTSGGGDLTANINGQGRVEGDIRAAGALTLTAAANSEITGTVHDPVGALTVAGSIGRLLYTNGGTVTVASTGALTGVSGETAAIQSSAGALDVTVAGTVTGDIQATGTGAALMFRSQAGSRVTGTVHDPTGSLTVAGSIGRLLYTNGGTVSVASTGAITGVEGEGIISQAGDLSVTVAGGSTVGGNILADGGGDLTAAIAGTVDGDIQADGELTFSAEAGSVITGTVYDPVGPLTVVGTIGRLLYTNGAVVTVAAGGHLTGVPVEGGRQALRSQAGDLSVLVAGGTTVGGDISAGEGELMLTAEAESVITGTVHDPVGPLTVVGSIGRLLYTNGAVVTVAAGGHLTGVPVEGGRQALRSDAGNLSVTVAAGTTVGGDIRGLGDGDLTANISGWVDGDVVGSGGGEHVVTVPDGGTVTGTVHLDGSTVTVHGTVGRSIILAKSGTVTVGPGGTVGNGEAPGDYGVQIVGMGEIVTHGTIVGKNGISVGPGSTVTAGGEVRSTDGAAGEAFRFRGGKDDLDSLKFLRGARWVGGIYGLSGADPIDPTRLNDADRMANVFAYFDEKGNRLDPDSLNILGRERDMVCTRKVCGKPDTTTFALTDDMLSDLTGSIHGAVMDTETVLRRGDPAAGRVVWAAPFGGARDQNGRGDVANATHYFGGGMIGMSWGAKDVRVGGFIGGSVGQLAGGKYQGNQTTDVDVQTLFFGLAASRALGPVLYDARLLVGSLTHDSTRSIPGVDTAEGNYSSVFFSPEVGVATTLTLTDTLEARPRVRVRYAGLFTEGFQESGPMTGWDMQFAERTLHVVEARAEVGIPFALADGGWINPRVGVEGRYLLSGSEIGVMDSGKMVSYDAGGDDGVITGTAGFGMTLPVAEATTLVGNFDGALTTEEAWRATGYLGLTYSF